MSDRIMGWLSGVVRRLDRVEDLTRKCETAIATGRHITYEEVTHVADA